MLKNHLLNSWQKYVGGNPHFPFHQKKVEKKKRQRNPKCWTTNATVKDAVTAVQGQYLPASGLSPQPFAICPVLPPSLTAAPCQGQIEKGRKQRRRMSHRNKIAIVQGAEKDDEEQEPEGRRCKKQGKATAAAFWPQKY